MPALLLHILPVPVEAMIHVSNTQHLDDLLSAPNIDGYYYEFIDHDDKFRIVHHTQEKPYTPHPAAHYSGPINAEDFLELHTYKSLPFRGIAVSCATEIIVRDATEKSLDKFNDAMQEVVLAVIH